MAKNINIPGWQRVGAKSYAKAFEGGMRATVEYHKGRPNGYWRGYVWTYGIQPHKTAKCLSRLAAAVACELLASSLPPPLPDQLQSVSHAQRMGQNARHTIDALRYATGKSMQLRTVHIPTGKNNLLVKPK